MSWMGLHGRRPGMVLALQLVAVGAPDDLLELEVRRRIYDYVRSYPGMHLREIARAVDLEMNHAKYHLQYMEKHGLVSSRRDEGYWRFFPRQEGSVGWRDDVPAASKQTLALLRRPVPLHVAVLLLDHGELNQTQIQDAVGVAASTLHYHLNHMEAQGVVASERRGRERICRLVDAQLVAALLVKYRPPPALVADFLEAWEQLDLDARFAGEEVAVGDPDSGPAAGEGTAVDDGQG